MVAEYLFKKLPTPDIEEFRKFLKEQPAHKPNQIEVRNGENVI